MFKKLSLITAVACLSTTLYANPTFSQNTNSKYNEYNKKNEQFYKDNKIVEVKDDLSKDNKYVEGENSRYSSTGTTSVFRNTYVGVSVAQNFSDTKSIFGGQPIGELVGEDGQEYQLRIGTYVNNASTNIPMSRVFAYVWNNPEKNGEIGLGFGGELIGRPFDTVKLDFILGGQIGYGKQFVSGDKEHISTSLNKLSFVTDTGVMNPTDITFQEDTAVLDIALTLGTTYEFSKVLSMDLAYVYKYNQYQVDYRTDENPNVDNNMSFQQGNNQIKIGFNYKF